MVHARFDFPFMVLAACVSGPSEKEQYALPQGTEVASVFILNEYLQLFGSCFCSCSENITLFFALALHWHEAKVSALFS